MKRHDNICWVCKLLTFSPWHYELLVSTVFTKYWIYTKILCQILTLRSAPTLGIWISGEIKKIERQSSDHPSDIIMAKSWLNKNLMHTAVLFYFWDIHKNPKFLYSSLIVSLTISSLENHWKAPEFYRGNFTVVSLFYSWLTAVELF